MRDIPGAVFAGFVNENKNVLGSFLYVPDVSHERGVDPPKIYPAALMMVRVGPMLSHVAWN